MDFFGVKLDSFVFVDNSWVQSSGFPYVQPHTIHEAFVGPFLLLPLFRSLSLPLSLSLSPPPCLALIPM